MAEKQANEALEKLNQGVQKTKQMVQLQTMELAQEYFVDSIEMFRHQVKGSRVALEDLPKQIPWGQEESFQAMFQDLVENYAAIEKALDEAGKNVAGLDTEQLRKQGELKATVAARREAKKRGVDLREVEGTGSGGRILVDDVRRAYKEAKHEATEEAGHEAAEKEEDEEEPKMPDAAKRKAEELGIRLEQMEDAGSGGLSTGDGAASLDKGERETATGTKEEDSKSMWQTSGNEDGKERNATNAAKRKAEELGVDPKEIQGTGPGGLITMSDVLKKVR